MELGREALINKDVVLPLINDLAIKATRENSGDIALVAAQAQQEADWCRVEPILDTILKVAGALDSSMRIPIGGQTARKWLLDALAQLGIEEEQ